MLKWLKRLQWLQWLQWPFGHRSSRAKLTCGRLWQHSNGQRVAVVVDRTVVDAEIAELGALDSNGASHEQQIGRKFLDESDILAARYRGRTQLADRLRSFVGLAKWKWKWKWNKLQTN